VFEAQRYFFVLLLRSRGRGSGYFNVIDTDTAVQLRVRKSKEGRLLVRWSPVTAIRKSFRY